jgi:hypothetical protein
MSSGGPITSPLVACTPIVGPSPLLESIRCRNRPLRPFTREIERHTGLDLRPRFNAAVRRWQSDYFTPQSVLTIAGQTGDRRLTPSAVSSEPRQGLPA